MINLIEEDVEPPSRFCLYLLREGEGSTNRLGEFLRGYSQEHSNTTGFRIYWKERVPVREYAHLLYEYPNYNFMCVGVLLGTKERSKTLPVRNFFSVRRNGLRNEDLTDILYITSQGEIEVISREGREIGRRIQVLN